MKFKSHIASLMLVLSMVAVPVQEAHAAVVVNAVVSVATGIGDAIGAVVNGVGDIAVGAFNALTAGVETIGGFVLNTFGIKNNWGDDASCRLGLEGGRDITSNPFDVTCPKPGVPTNNNNNVNCDLVGTCGTGKGPKNNPVSSTTLPVVPGNNGLGGNGGLGGIAGTVTNSICSALQNGIGTQQVILNKQMIWNIGLTDPKLTGLVVSALNVSGTDIAVGTSVQGSANFSKIYTTIGTKTLTATLTGVLAGVPYVSTCTASTTVILDPGTSKEI